VTRSTSSGPEFGVDVRVAGDATVVVIHGDVDMSTAGELWEQLSPVIERGSGDIRFDLAAVPFFDSTGVGVLAQTTRACQGTGRSVIVERPQAAVRRVLDITGINALVVVEPETDTGVDFEDG